MPKYKIIKDYNWGSAIAGVQNGKLIYINDIKPKVGDIIEGDEISNIFSFNQYTKGIRYTIYYDDGYGGKRPFISIIPESSLEKISENTSVVPIIKKQDTTTINPKIGVGINQISPFFSNLNDFQKAIILVGSIILINELFIKK